MNLYIVILIFFILYYFYKYNYSINSRLKLQGPTPIPFLGNVHQIIKQPLETFANLALKYNHFYRIWIGTSYYCLVSDPVIIREIFVNNFSNFKDHSKSNKCFYGSEEHGLAANSISWDKSRSVFAKAVQLFTKKSFNDFLVKKSFQLMDMYKINSNSIIINNSRLFFQTYTISVMSKLVFNKDLDLKKDQEIINTTVSNLENILLRFKKLFFLNDFLGFFNYLLHSFVVIDFKKNLFTKIFIKMKIIERIKETNYNDDLNFKPKDVLDYYIYENGKNNINEFQIDHIIATCLEFFLGGSETTASTIEWAFLHLINDKQLQETIYNELKSLNVNFIRNNERLKTPLLNSFIKEILRFRPVGGLGIPHKTSNDIIIKGKYFIPKNSSIIINFKGISFNENVYENANRFIPDRFLNSDEQILTFGSGPRNCPGSRIALKETTLFISNFILNYKIDSVDGKKIKDKEFFSLTVQPEIYKFKAIKR
ncbi:hypothetical protein ACTFIU_003594 [Dictyostelium citrinum]